ncbi:MAG: hypothetical protein KF718_29375 [Polyangiaceae bacterium]|nr:hypothetical protein [Polyangiaceae bacterium]
MAGEEHDRDEAEDPAPTGSGHTIEQDSIPSEPRGAAWALPFVKVDVLWTRWEAWLCAAVLLTEVIVLSLWVSLKGLSTPPDAGKAGLVFRAITGAMVLGLIAFFAAKKAGKVPQRIASVSAVLIGVFAAKYWQNVGIEWSTNLLNWYQQASTLTLVGGLRGVGTRLTLLLALLGGSLATASGKHITIDLVTRFVSSRVRLPMVIAGWVGTALICGAAAWGFFDHIAIEDFGAKADARPTEKFKAVTSGMGEDLFIARKQASLDMKSLPKVLKGERYSEWLTGSQWNAWLEESGFVERYGREKIDALKMSNDLTRSPIVVVPERGEPRGELIKAANLVFPFGLLVMAFRFLLLSLLAFAGHISTEPELEGADIKQRGGEDDDGIDEPVSTAAEVPEPASARADDAPSDDAPSDDPRGEEPEPDDTRAAKSEPKDVEAESAPTEGAGDPPAKEPDDAETEPLPAAVAKTDDAEGSTSDDPSDDNEEDKS